MPKLQVYDRYPFREKLANKRVRIIATVLAVQLFVSQVRPWFRGVLHFFNINLIGVNDATGGGNMIWRLVYKTDSIVDVFLRRKRVRNFA